MCSVPRCSYGVSTRAPGRCEGHAVTIYEDMPYDEPPTPSTWERWVPGHGWELIPTAPPGEVAVVSSNPLPGWRVAQGFYYDRLGLLRKKEA